MPYWLTTYLDLYAILTHYLPRSICHIDSLLTSIYMSYWLTTYLDLYAILTHYLPRSICYIDSLPTSIYMPYWLTTYLDLYAILTHYLPRSICHIDSLLTSIYMPYWLTTYLDQLTLSWCYAHWHLWSPSLPARSATDRNCEQSAGMMMVASGVVLNQRDPPCYHRPPN